MLTYDELINNRRSIRDFQDKQISKEILQEILHDTCKAPSASNTQPWRFLVLQDKELMQRLSTESKKNLLNEITANPDHPIKMYAKSLSNSNFNVYYNAPCLVLIVGENDYPYFERDCANAAIYFMFAATARGLGTCWIGLGDSIQDSALKTEIGLPNGYQIEAALILGYPTKIPSEIPRNEPIILKSIGV